MNEAENVIHRASINRDAGALRGGKDFHDLIERSLNRQSVHIRAGNHDLPDLQLAQLDGAENEFFFSDRQQSSFTCLLDLDLQFFGGMGDAVPCGPYDTQCADDSAEIPSRRSMAQRKELRNHAKGRATIRAMRSARARLMVLGTSSPNTTWMALRIRKG